MSKDVAGIKLSQFQDPIREALSAYSEIADGRVEFDLENAGKLALTPDKPNTARSATVVKHLGEVMGDLYVIAFKPEDGTGDGKAIGLDDVNTGHYPRNVGVVPRPKTGIYAESHLALVSQAIEDPNADQKLFAGSLSLLGLRDGTVVRLAQLGQADARFVDIIRNTRAEAAPTATYTVGYSAEGRFGDPHAVFNNHPEAIQVCGFIAVTDNLAGKHQAALALLGSEHRVQY